MTESGLQIPITYFILNSFSEFKFSVSPGKLSQLQRFIDFEVITHPEQAQGDRGEK